MITAQPDCITEKLTDADKFMVVACDGIWDVLSSQEVQTHHTCPQTLVLNGTALPLFATAVATAVATVVATALPLHLPPHVQHSLNTVDMAVLQTGRRLRQRAAPTGCVVRDSNFGTSAAVATR